MGKISRVNDVPLTYEQNSNVVGTSTTYPVVGNGSSQCTLSDNEWGTSYMYNGGFVFEATPIPQMTYRVFMFKSEAERQLALQETANAGLQYAKQMKGANGCDSEVIYEFQPMSGGGVKVEISVMGQPAFDVNSAEGMAAKKSISDTLIAYRDPSINELIMTFDAETVRLAKGLEIRGDCDRGNLTAMRFSTQFICKNTGAPINITSLRWKDARGIWSEISTDPSNPSIWHVPPYDAFYGVNASYCKGSECPSCEACNANNYMSDWYLEVDAANASESCGSFYWDPLIASTVGDGRGASALASSPAPAPSPNTGPAPAPGPSPSTGATTSSTMKGAVASSSTTAISLTLFAILSMVEQDV